MLRKMELAYEMIFGEEDEIIESINLSCIPVTKQ